MFVKDPIAQARKDLQSAFSGHSLNMRKREGDWWLTTTDGSAGVSISTFWRLRGSSRILVSVEDDGHQFGLPEPVDVEASANGAMANLTVSNIDIDGATGDLRFLFPDGMSLEIIVTSAGYECWQAHEGGPQHSALLAFGCSGGGGFRN